MARTPEQIYNSMLQAKDTLPGMTGATSTSETAIYRLVFYTVSIVISVFEQILDVFTRDINYQKSVMQSKNELFWKDRMLNFFQFDPNDSSSGVVIRDPVNYTYYYRTVDPTKRIIKFCSVTSINGLCTIKIAKADSNGLPVQCTIEEVQSAFSMVQSVQDAGANIIVTSFPTDSVFVNAQVFYNGQYVLSTVQNWIEQAVADYFEQLPFDGQFLKSDLVEYVKDIQGGDVVRDFYLLDIQAKADGGAYDIVERNYITTSGYIKLDTQITTYEFKAQK